MRFAATIPIIIIAFTVSACSGGGSNTETFMVRDSAGIRIVENFAPVWGEGDEWQLSEQAVCDIGAQEGDPDYELYRVPNAMRLPDGRIVIANSGTHEIRLYDPSCSHLFDAGGEGEGPGEFSLVSWVSRYRGDSIAAYDMRLMRVSLFDSDGQFGRSFPVRGMDASGRGRALGVFDDGSVLVAALVMNAPNDGSEGFRLKVPLYTVSPEGESRDSICVSPGDEMFVYSVGSPNQGNRLEFFGPPMFGRTTEYAIHGNRFYVAANDSYEIRVHEPRGGLESIVRRRHDPIAVTNADIDASREDQLDGDMPPGMRQTMIDMLDATPIRETMPADDGVLVDRIGNLWVEGYRRPGDTVPRWTVFDPQGVMLGSLALPDRFEALDVGDDYVLGKWVDELGIEHLRMYELMKR